MQLVHVELHADFVDGSKHTTHRMGQQLVHSIWAVHAKLKVRMYVKSPSGLVFLCANRAADAAKVLAVLQDQREVPWSCVAVAHTRDWVCFVLTRRACHHVLCGWQIKSLERNGQASMQSAKGTAALDAYRVDRAIHKHSKRTPPTKPSTSEL